MNLIKSNEAKEYSVGDGFGHKFTFNNPIINLDTVQEINTSENKSAHGSIRAYLIRFVFADGDVSEWGYNDEKARNRAYKLLLAKSTEI